MNKTSYQKKALLLGIAFIIITIACLFWIVLHTKDGRNLKPFFGPNACAEMIADIYQNGKLLDSIPLSSVTEGYIFTVEGENGSRNEIEVRPGSIGIVSASCPDKLCVHQGFISNSLLPITCLPNRLVIQIRQTNTTMKETDRETEAEEIIPDIITY